MKLDRFVLALLIAVVLAYFFPEAGVGQSGQVMGRVASVGISLIFFFYGLKLSPEKIKAGLSNWRLHILVQASTFLVFPLLVLFAYPLVAGKESEIIWLGFFFLAALPSTVSSSVVMVSMAKGNIPSAIFNASLSGIIGIMLTPLWMGLFLQNQSDFDFTQIYLRLIFEILLPVIAGSLLQRKGHKYVIKYLKQLTLFDKSVILLIVYKSFAASFSSKMFAGIGFLEILLIFILVVVLFFALYGLVFLISKMLKFDRDDRITALFCGSKKSLVHGTVFSKVLFGQMTTIGIVLLPLMLYHAFQILIISVIAGRYGRKAENRA